MVGLSQTKVVRKKFDTPFVAKDTSPICFGKLKGSLHKVLKDEEHQDYVDWLLGTEDDFAEVTKLYIKKHVLPHRAAATAVASSDCTLCSQCEPVVA